MKLNFLCLRSFDSILLMRTHYVTDFPLHFAPGLASCGIRGLRCLSGKVTLTLKAFMTVHKTLQTNVII